MQKYNITGMSCAACQVRVEKAVKSVKGVSSCSVSLLTNSMNVEGTASSDDIIKAIENAGYGANLKDGRKENKVINNDETQFSKMKNRLIASLLFLLPLIYFSMGHMMWKWPIPEFFDGNCIAIGIYEMLLAVIVMVINQNFFINGFKGIIHRSPNMDTLVSLGSAASFIYSLYALFAMTLFQNDVSVQMQYMNEFYFESAAMILTLITVGKLLEARSKGKTTDALKSLMKLAPKTAVILKDGEEITVAVDEVKRGDIFVVKPGSQIPVDGIVKEGFSAVNESAFTGESLPVDKIEGDNVYSATMNINGFMLCEATKTGEDTSISKIIQMVSDAAATKAPIAKIADRVSGIFVPAVISIAVVTFLVWMLVGQTFGYSLARAISVLVISCPCALGLATPVAIMVGNGVAAKSGILFKNAIALEQTGKVKIVALDKTGTITTGKMQVTDIIPTEGVSAPELLKVAASLEAKSEHPISKAITEKAKEETIDIIEVSDFKVIAGNGLSGIVDNTVTYGGNEEFIKKSTHIEKDRIYENLRKIAENGKTPVIFASSSKLLGIIAVSDTIKKDSKEAIRQLKNMGIQVVMLTGDNEVTANAIAKEVEVDEVIASVKPDGKEKTINSLMQKGKVAMVGDGINDAPALTKADIGIAIGAGTDIAIDAANIVLTKNSLMDVASAIKISKSTIKNIHENLFWAFFYNTVGIPLAAGCFVSAFGWSLNPMFGAAAMSLSSFCVVSNALRLNFVKIYKFETEETDIMKIKVKGMMCPRCEAHVKEALENIDGIENVAASHSENLVTLKLSKKVLESDIKLAIKNAGYKYCGIIQ